MAQLRIFGRKIDFYLNRGQCIDQPSNHRYNICSFLTQPSRQTILEFHLQSIAIGHSQDWETRNLRWSKDSYSSLYVWPLCLWLLFPKNRFYRFLRRSQYDLHFQDQGWVLRVSPECYHSELRALQLFNFPFWRVLEKYQNFWRIPLSFVEPNQIIRHIDLFEGLGDQSIDLGDRDSKASLK